MERLEQVVVMQGSEGKEPSPFIHTWEAFRRLGRESADRLKGERAPRVTETKPEDVATIVYTSGTTGPPKGVVQVHRNHMAALEAAAQVLRVEEGWVHLLFLPLAHSFGRLESFTGPHRGPTSAFAARNAKLPQT